MFWIGIAGLLAVAGQQSPPVFSSSTEIARVLVSVTDEAGRPIRGLTSSDFNVEEDGKRRPLENVAVCADATQAEAAECSVDLVLVLDTSGSMSNVLTKAIKVAEQFLVAVPLARGRNVVAFDSKVRDWPYDATAPLAPLVGILKEEPSNETCFFDAVRKASSLASNSTSRRAILVSVTDGEETCPALRKRLAKLRDRITVPVGQLVEEALSNTQNSEEAALEEALREPLRESAQTLQRDSVTFYAISFAKNLRTEFLGKHRERFAANSLQSLAKQTGGLVIEGDATDLDAQFALIRDDIASQYVLGFVPALTEKSRRHKLKVTTKIKGARVRHQLAYEARSANPDR